MAILKKKLWLIIGACMAWVMALLGFSISGCSDSVDDTVMPAYGVPYSTSSTLSSSDSSAGMPDKTAAGDTQ